MTPEQRCTRSHVQCSHSHAELVQSYREERERQERVREEHTGGYATEESMYPRLIDFRTWLIGSKHGRR